MRRNHISFPIYKLDELEHIEQGNLMPNFDWFIDNVLRKEPVKDLYELWNYTYSCISETNGREYSLFLHELGTVLLNAKRLSGSYTIGFSYGALAITTYENNTSPNILEIYVVWPKYSPNPIDVIEDISRKL